MKNLKKIMPNKLKRNLVLMPNIRTIYRKKRIEIIRDILNILITYLLLSKFKLEKIKLDFFKKIKKQLQDELERVDIDRERYRS